MVPCDINWMVKTTVACTREGRAGQRACRIERNGAFVSLSLLNTVPGIAARG